MLHQPPPKFHSNPLSHLLSLHANTNGSTSLNAINPLSPQSAFDSRTHPNQTTHSCHQTMDVVNGPIGKSFTIAAILGLKKNAAAAAAAAVGANNGEHNNNNSVFSNVMNLSLNHHRHFGNHHNPTNSALQSLQQLHQHHAATGFTPRERPREGVTKKSSVKSKRVRTIFTPEQLERLEAEFERQQYMVGPERLYLAHTLQLTEAQVKVWFQNRRIKWRKHHLEITHQRLALLRQRQLPNSTETHHVPVDDSELTICSDSMDTESTPDICNES